MVSERSSTHRLSVELERNTPAPAPRANLSMDDWIVFNEIY